MRRLSSYVLALVVAALASCDKPGPSVTLHNPLNAGREEVVAIPLDKLGPVAEGSHWTAFDGSEKLPVQLFDANNDAQPDQLLVFVRVEANADKRIEFRPGTGIDSTSSAVYSRFVPERIDDYAWENDRVAFRTYGPEAQRLVDDGEPGGTLSSGIDCWLKRVDYLIIDKWYEKPSKGGTYHHDDGEGYDPYHVGASRGCGGPGVWKDDSLYVSKNFVSYKTLAEGPLRASFELTYKPWGVDSVTVAETMRITIDRGEQLCRVDLNLKPNDDIPNITLGITLHKKDGEVMRNAQKGIFSYWETLDDSELGTGLYVPPSEILDDQDFRTPMPDLSHILVITKPAATRTYYTGFGWKKAGIITSATDWNNYLDEFSRRKNSPIELTWK